MTSNTIQKIVDFKDIGRVCFRASKGKNLTVSVHPGKGVQVAVPKHISLERAYAFVQQKKNWIRKQQAKIKYQERKNTRFDASTSFRTREHVLKLHTHHKSSIRIEINKSDIHVSFPEFADIDDQRVQNAIRHAILETWRLEAKKLLPPLVESLAKKHGFVYNKLRIRNNRTRWGSCSKDNNISLNVHLMRLPQYLCEYVILHELVHTVHKNHQPSFWQSLDRVAGNARMLDKELAKYKIDVW